MVSVAICFWASSRIPLSTQELFKVGRSASVAITPGGQNTKHTGFFLESDIVATCSEAVSDAKSGKPVRIIISTPVYSLGNSSKTITSTGNETRSANIVVNYGNVAILKIGAKIADEIIGRGSVALIPSLPFNMNEPLQGASAKLDINTPTEGDDVAVVAQEAGFSGQHLLIRQGMVESMDINNIGHGMSPPEITANISVEYRDGFCGGPVLNKRGRVLGMIFRKNTMELVVS